MSRPEQLPFDLPHRDTHAREDLWVFPANAEAVAWIDRWPQWEAPALVIHGPAAAGKTHLARLWQKKAQAVAVTLESLEPLCGAAHFPKALLADDAETLIGDQCAETFLFHAWNRAKEEGGHLLLTARRAPKDWAFALPDLRSRLLAAPAVSIGAPDEQAMAVVLAKLFSDRQLFVPQEVIGFILTRIERSFAALRDLAGEIDRKALAEKRAVTVPLVREILQAQGRLL
jgi:DnaA regulatory inactivator Hda